MWVIISLCGGLSLDGTKPSITVVYLTSDTVQGCCIKIKDQEHTLIKFTKKIILLYS